MKKHGTVKKMLSKIVFAGLLVSSLPATVPVRAQQVTVMPQLFVQPKLSKKEIDKKIKRIKKTVKILKTANVIVPIFIVGAGIAIFVVSAGVAVKTTPKFVKQLWDRYGFKSMTEDIKEISKTAVQWARIIPPLVALGALLVTPIATTLSFIGLSGASLVVPLQMAGQLERMEKKHPGTLSEDQRLVIVQLKNMIKGPVARGLIKYFSLKKAMKVAVNNALVKNPALGSKIAFGQPKKAHKVIAKYIKLKWTEENAQKGIGMFLKEAKPGQQKKAKKAVEKIKKKVKKLVGKYPHLPQSVELKEAVREFGQKANSILEGLKKPVFKKKEPKPIFVPLS